MDNIDSFQFFHLQIFTKEMFYLEKGIDSRFSNQKIARYKKFKQRRCLTKMKER